MTEEEPAYLDSLLNLLTLSKTRDDVVSVVYCFPVGCAVFLALTRSLITLLTRGQFQLHQLIMFILMLSALLITTTPTAFIVTTSALLRPKPYCGALYNPPLRVDQDYKFYVLTTGKPLRPGTAWLPLDTVTQSADDRVLSETCMTGVRKSVDTLEEHVLTAPQNDSAHYTHTRRQVSMVGGVVEFSRGRFYFVSDCLDVERWVTRLMGSFSPVRCTSGYVHSDQLSYLTSIVDDNNDI